ncbi:MAG: hypothetical protein WAT78_12775 [Rhizobiaceae bacterium]
MSTQVAFAENIIISDPSKKGVIVWKSPEHAKEGNVLRAGNADALLIAPLVSCIVENGTSAIMVRDSGYFKFVVVASGSEAGCRGVISIGEFR